MTSEAGSIPFEQLLAQRLTRRSLLQTGVALAPLAVAGDLFAAAPTRSSVSLSFRPVPGSTADAVVLPDGYTHDVVARWGDSLFKGTANLDTRTLVKGALMSPQAAIEQARQFGTHCDAIQFFALDERGRRGVLCVNNEYTEDATLFPGHPGFGGANSGAVHEFVLRHPGVVAMTQAAQGVSVIEVRQRRGRWQLVPDSKFNRRITAQTPIDVGGPARGATLMRTMADPAGVQVLGTFGNCAGGRTPWGTYLTAEENIQDYFGNLAALKSSLTADPFVVDAHRRFRMWSRYSPYGWESVDARFDLTRNPCEPFRFGWIVEIDPLHPDRPPVKRTALGRFAHEGASPVIATNGRVAVYMGDDDKFEYVYKFVSRASYDPVNAAANRDLLDDGTLYVARFDAQGAGRWLPLVYDPQGPLNEAAGFRSQADVLIKARAAATVLGATPMDRPEDVEANPVNGRVYIACTRNENRTPQSVHKTYAGRALDVGPNIANPRGANPWGHIIELQEAGNDHTALEFSWNVFLLAGDPRGRLIADLDAVQPGTLDADTTYYAGYARAHELSPIGSPDNIGFDGGGNLWIVTDGSQPNGSNNGCWACPTTGEQRGRLQQFMSGPVGAEVCGCCFTPDGKTLFLSIQHPGEGGSIERPRSHWPDGPGSQPRPSVIAIRRKDGGRIGT